METPNTPDMPATIASHFGKILQDARNAKGLTLQQAADELNIMKRHLQALEEENYEALPPGAFSRGFLVNYAKFLGLNPTQLAESFEASYPAHLKPKSTAEIRAPLQPMGTLNRESRGRIKLNPFLIGGVILALGVGIFIFKAVNKARTDSQAQATQTATKPVKTDTVNTQDRISGASLANTGSAVPNATMAGNANSSTTGIKSGAVGSAVPSVATTSESSISQLEFWIKDSTNVSVIDATGKALLQGEQTKGGYKVSGQPPFKVSIDKVNNVNLDLDKRPIKLSDYAQNNQANFTLK